MKTRRSAHKHQSLEVMRPMKKTPKNNTSTTKTQTVPDVLYTDGGAIFYPCKHCCRAFARRADLKKHHAYCGKSMPLASVENTMDSRPQELNNNKSEELQVTTQGGDEEGEQGAMVQVKINYEDDADHIPEHYNVEILEEDPDDEETFPLWLGTLHTCDLATKARVVKTLNAALIDTAFSIMVKENGDVVVKMLPCNGLPQLEMIAAKSADGNKHQVCVRSSTEHRLPKLIDILETSFGPDAFLAELRLSSLKIEQQQQPQSPTTVMEADPSDSTIVLEDLDIHICKQCGAVYHTLADLVTHDKYEHRMIKRKYSPEELEKYAMVFKASVDHICPICSKQLRGKSSWARHAQSHCEIGMFACGVCRKKFTRDDHRKSHESRHLINATEA